MQYLHDASDADEVVNDTFMSVWDKRSDLTLDENLRPLLYTIVRNKSISLLRKRKLEVTLLDEGFDVPDTGHTPAELLQARETERKVMELIEKLPPRCRQIFILSRKEGMANLEIADLMEISEKTVENQITIAIRYIRSGLNREDKMNNISSFTITWLLPVLAEVFT